MLNMSKKDIENHIKNLLTKEMKKSSSNKLPNSSNASYNIYSESWATSIAVDIVKFKDSVINGYERKRAINIMQAFTSTIIKISKENPNFISAYVNGDQVIANFSSATKKDMASVYGTAIKINSAINVLMPKILQNHWYKNEFKVGIGIWASNNNSLIKYGEKGSSEESFTTLVGDAINFSTQLSDLANRNGQTPILMNWNFYNNIKDFKNLSPHLIKLAKLKINNEDILGSIAVFEEYELN